MTGIDPRPADAPAQQPVRSRRDLALVVPSDEQLLQMRVDARSQGKLPQLQRLVAAWQSVGEKCKLAFEELTRLAVHRLQVERDLGEHLAQTVKRGGDRPNSPRGSLLRQSGLPDDITWQQSSLYQKLAAIPAEVFQAYLDEAARRHIVPSSRGARTFARTRASANAAARRRSRRAAGGQVRLPAEVLDRIAAGMRPDVVVGRVDLPAKERFPAGDRRALERLCGAVFVALCPDAAEWLPEIARRWRDGRISRAIVVLPGTIAWASWFAHAIADEAWTLCFVSTSKEGPGALLADIGGSPAFLASLDGIGVTFVPSPAAYQRPTSAPPPNAR